MAVKFSKNDVAMVNNVLETFNNNAPLQQHANAITIRVLPNSPTHLLLEIVLTHMNQVKTIVKPSLQTTLLLKVMQRCIDELKQIPAIPENGLELYCGCFDEAGELLYCFEPPVAVTEPIYLCDGQFHLRKNK